MRYRNIKKVKNEKTKPEKLSVLTGSQFRQYVHISTRKMKYLMDNDIVPHLNTGQATHKYEIKKSDADEYLRKTRFNTKFISETKGLFSSRKNHSERIRLINDRFIKNSISYLEALWRDQPKILTAQSAAELIGANRQYIRRVYEENKLKGIIFKNTITFSKKDFISFLCKKERLAYPPTMKMNEIIAKIEETFK